ncbi:UNVERIFIED_CONTAM: hypothetical protein FKN15_053484 [Acipenser sinensis]
MDYATLSALLEQLDSRREVEERRREESLSSSPKTFTNNYISQNTMYSVTRKLYTRKINQKKNIIQSLASPVAFAANHITMLNCRVMRGKDLGLESDLPMLEGDGPTLSTPYKDHVTVMYVTLPRDAIFVWGNSMGIRFPVTQVKCILRTPAGH